MSVFLKGLFSRRNNFTEEIENIFVLTSRSSGYFQATCDHFHSRFRKDRKECKRGNALIGPAIGRKFFSCRSEYQKEYSDT